MGDDPPIELPFPRSEMVLVGRSPPWNPERLGAKIPEALYDDIWLVLLSPVKNICLLLL